jgi:hypothetical protein
VPDHGASVHARLLFAPQPHIRGGLGFPDDAARAFGMPGQIAAHGEQFRDAIARGYGGQVRHAYSEYPQRPGIGAGRSQDGDVPPGHHLVEEPRAGEPHRRARVGGDGDQLVPQRAGDAQASCPASDVIYPLSTSASGIDGSSNHDASIP